MADTPDSVINDAAIPEATTAIAPVTDANARIALFRSTSRRLELRDLGRDPEGMAEAERIARALNSTPGASFFHDNSIQGAVGSIIFDSEVFVVTSDEATSTPWMVEPSFQERPEPTKEEENRTWAMILASSSCRHMEGKTTNLAVANALLLAARLLMNEVGTWESWEGVKVLSCEAAMAKTQGNWQEAFEILEKAAPIAESNLNGYELADFLTAFGEASLRSPYFQYATAALGRALNILQGLSHSDMLPAQVVAELSAKVERLLSEALDGVMVGI
jgi:hypothetical protein